MSVVHFKTSRVYDELVSGQQQGKDVFVLEGGARSTKTSSIIQFIQKNIFEADVENRALEVLILRETAKESKLVTLKDFFKISKIYNVPVSPEMRIGRAVQMYNIGESSILFEGCNNYEEFLGSEFDIIWMNEAMPMSYNVYRALKDRCRMFMILDYNPNRTEHWIYDKVIPSPLTTFIHSTMLDNGFLHPNIRRSILSSEPTPTNIAAGTADPIHWKIYGLGQRAELKGLIYTDVNYVDEFPDKCNWVAYGLDFGFTQAATALVKVGLKDGELWMEEMIYEHGLTNLPPKGDKGEHTRNIDYHLRESGVKKSYFIIADNAELKSITELQGEGWYIIPVQKGRGSINEGIGILQRYRFNVVNSSSNLRKELSNYKWRESEANPDWTQEDNRRKNQPVDAFNDLLDAARYVALMKLRGTVQKSRSSLIGVR